MTIIIQKPPGGGGGGLSAPLEFGGEEARAYFKDDKSYQAYLRVRNDPKTQFTLAGLWDTTDDKVHLRVGGPGEVFGHPVYDHEGTPGIKDGAKLKPHIYGFGGVAESGQCVIKPATGHFDKSIPPELKPRFEAIMGKLFAREFPQMQILQQYE